MNKVNLIGRLTRNVDFSTIGNEKISKASFTIAVKRNYKNANGEYESDFIQCVAFRNTADFINKYFQKGDEIAASGRIQTRSYDTQDGTKRYVTEVIIEEVEFTYGKSDKNKDSKPEATTTVNQEDVSVPTNYKTDYVENEIHLTDEDLPF